MPPDSSDTSPTSPIFLGLIGGYEDTDPPAASVDPAVRAYCEATILEECGETISAHAKGVRFDFDSPMRADDPDVTARVAFETEVGHVESAIAFARLHGVLDVERVAQARDAKLVKLLSDATDNLGRRLAPKVPDDRLLAAAEADPRAPMRAILDRLETPIGRHLRETNPTALLDEILAVCRGALAGDDRAE